MLDFSILGEEERDLKRQVDADYSTFWRPILELIRLGYLTYSEAMEINRDDLYCLWYGAQRVEESFSRSEV